MASSETQKVQFQAGQLAGPSNGAPGVAPGAGSAPPFDSQLVNVVARLLGATPSHAMQVLLILPNLPQLANEQTMNTMNRQQLKAQLQRIVTVVNYYEKCKQSGERFDENTAFALPPTAPLPLSNADTRQAGATQQGQMQGVVHQPGQQQALSQNQPQLQPLQSQAMTTADFQPPLAQLGGIIDPTNITGSISSDPLSHRDPGALPFTSLRPTLTGGMVRGLQDGTPALIQQPLDDPSMLVSDIRPTSLRKNAGAEQHVRKKIQDMVASVDSSVKVDAEAEDLLLEIADEFIDSVANFTCRLTKHRKGEMVDIKDLQLHLEMHHGIRIPGFTVDAPTQAHGSAAALAAATAAQAQGAGAGEGARPSGGGGGTKKGGGATGGAAGMKRSSRLAAVTQAKKDARLL